MKLHHRTTIVGYAKNEISEFVCASIEKHHLTAAEVVSVLAHLTADYCRYPLRAERHPNDPDKKADEA